MRVDWAVVCRYVEAVGGLATMVGAGIDTYSPPGFPAPLQVFMAVRVVGHDEELGLDHEHVFGVKVLDPDMQLISELSTSFASEANPQKPPGWEAGTIIPVVHVFEAGSPGVYTIELSVDGRGHSISIIVQQAATAEPPPDR